MKFKVSVLPYKKQFPMYLQEYSEQISEAIKFKKHHDQRRSLFMNFLRLAFDVEPTEVELEAKVKVAKLRGYIDALYKFLIFEFKTDLERERSDAEMELSKYFRAQKRPEEFVAVLTDGVKFEVAQYVRGSLEWISVFELDANDPLGCFRFFDSLIFLRRKITPKSNDITTKFGLESAVFNRIKVMLTDLFCEVEGDSSVEVKFKEWNSLLAMVYGDPIGDRALFLTHTYLAVLARLMVANALYPKANRGKVFYRGVMTGEFFRKGNLPNMAEPDFFCWALETEVESEFLDILSKMESYLETFRFDSIGEDLLKEIYQELVDRSSRHSLGEYYTPA